jgi:hypothetical protein
VGERYPVNEEKSTDQIRMIAQSETRRQAEVCAARRDHLTEKLEELAEAVKENVRAIASLTLSTSTLSATVVPMVVTVKEHSSIIEKLKGRPAVWAAIVAALPTLLGVLLWWFSR